MPYLAPEVVTRWSNAKKNLTSSLAKVKPNATLKQSTIDTLKKNLDGFDGGLTPKLKKAAAAKDDKEAVLAIGESINIIKGYKTKIGEWGKIGSNIGTQLTTILNEVQTACEHALVAINANTPRR
ncbi:MAG TPA: hypothetical protein VH253_18760 [Phycisphaerae bacterium]|nr:hypothetical protein [Phycisphaerae bacterium]